MATGGLFLNRTGNVGNITKARGQEFYVTGWFRFPIEDGINYEVIEILHDTFIVLSFLLNPVLLCMIIKNPGSSTRSNFSILLASLCLVNILASSFGVVQLLDTLIRPNDTRIISYEIMTRVMSIILPKYYTSTFLLALNNYGMIVRPLRFKIFAPKPGKMILITLSLWFGIGVVFVVPPYLVKDFNNYVNIMMTIVVVLCWLIVVVIMGMYIKILKTLRHRKFALQRTFNMNSSKQGLVVIKQNSRLARVLLFYIVIMVLSTLPLFTSLILVMHCPQCNQTANAKFCLYMIPVSMTMPIVHAFHWLVSTPQYYKELKRLTKQLLVFCRLINNPEQM